MLFAGIKIYPYICIMTIRQDMPTVFDILGLRGYFFSGDHLPVHLHVVKGNASAKIQVEPEIKVISNSGLKPKELSTALELVEKYHDEIMEMWNAYCG